MSSASSFLIYSERSNDGTLPVTWQILPIKATLSHAVSALSSIAELLEDSEGSNPDARHRSSRHSLGGGGYLGPGVGRRQSIVPLLSHEQEQEMAAVSFSPPFSVHPMRGTLGAGREIVVDVAFKPSIQQYEVRANVLIRADR